MTDPKDAAPMTSHGKVITDEVIEKMAAEAEAGIDLARLRPVRGRPLRGSGPTDVIQVRLEPAEREAVRQRAEADHSTTSDVIRKALHAYLPLG